MDRQSILAILKEIPAGQELGGELVCLDIIDSTNTECKRRAEAGAPHGLVVVSREQTGGRGRLGRSFQSPKDCGLYFSLLLRPRLSPLEVVDFTAWTAVAVCDAIEQVCGLRPRIKWTNDLVLNGKKLCGILTEMSLNRDTNALEYLVAGIGINVNHKKEDFDPELRDIATSLSMELGKNVDLSVLAAALIENMARMYSVFPQNKQEYLERYRADCMTTGHQVQLITPASRQQARAIAIDDEFRLVVELPDGSQKALSAGEVSVRGMYGYV